MVTISVTNGYKDPYSSFTEAVIPTSFFLYPSRNTLWIHHNFLSTVIDMYLFGIL